MKSSIVFEKLKEINYFKVNDNNIKGFLRFLLVIIIKNRKSNKLSITIWKIKSKLMYII